MKKEIRVKGIYKLSDTVTTVEQKALMGRQTRQLRCFGCEETIAENAPRGSHHIMLNQLR